MTSFETRTIVAAQTYRLPSALRSLRHRNYRLYLVGQLISVTGTWMQTAAGAWLAYRLTGSAALLGVVGFAAQFPLCLLASVGGAAADRYPRHRILIATQTASMFLAFVLAVLTLSGTIEVSLLIGIAVLRGIVDSFDIPARQSFVAQMVERDDLVNAIALNTSIFNGARIIGPSVAGVMVGAVGEGWCFFANGLSYVAVLIGLLRMHVPPKTIVARGHPWSDIVDGFRYAGQSRPVLSLLLVSSLLSLVTLPHTVLMPIFAKQILGGGPRELGALMSSPGVGALAGALTLASRQSVSGLTRWVAAGAAGFGVSLMLFSMSRTFWLSMLLLVPAGFGLIIAIAASKILIQSTVPDAISGRVMGVYSMLFMGIAPLGALAGGALGDAIGAPPTVAVVGALSLIAAGLFAFAVRRT